MAHCGKGPRPEINMPRRYQGFTFLGILNTWIPLPVRFFSSWGARWWGQASSMLGVRASPMHAP